MDKRCQRRGAAATLQSHRTRSQFCVSVWLRNLVLCFRMAYGPWDASRVQEIAETTRLARRAVELGRDDALALCWAGYSLAYVVGELHDGAAFIDRALQLNPNLARAWNLSGWVRIWLG